MPIVVKLIQALRAQVSVGIQVCIVIERKKRYLLTRGTANLALPEFRLCATLVE